MDKILVIEDEKNLRDTIKEILEINQYNVSTAQNGLIGLAKALQFKPDIIVCDVMMPEMDGFETLKNIRSITEISHTPFIFLTAKADKSDFREGMNSGADDFLNKPFNSKELIAVIKLRIKKVKKAKKEYSEEISKLKNEVGDLQNSIDNLSYNNSHVLRAPLLKIIGLINYLIEESVEKSQMDSEILNMLKHSCMELSDATIEVEKLLNNK
jgi:DNA-binding response OmpR family regulator